MIALTSILSWHRSVFLQIDITGKNKNVESIEQQTQEYGLIKTTSSCLIVFFSPAICIKRVKSIENAYYKITDDVFGYFI